MGDATLCCPKMQWKAAQRMAMSQSQAGWVLAHAILVAHLPRALLISLLSEACMNDWQPAVKRRLLDHRGTNDFHK